MFSASSHRAAWAALAAFLVWAAGGPVVAQFQMPDPKEMSGIPRPVDDLPPGSISVRLIRGELSNNIAGHPVELHIGTAVQTVNTDEAGRAQFDKVPPQRTAKAVATVDGERLESQEFPTPTQGGIRLLLVATDKEREARRAAEASAPAVAGPVTIGGDSRLVVEPDDEKLNVFYILEINNAGRAPVNPETPFVLQVPDEAAPATVLQGSSPLASVKGRRVEVSGPFPPGRTMLEIATSIPIYSGNVTIAQPFPAAVEQLMVIIKKTAAELRLVSPQIARQQDTAFQGTTVIVGDAGSFVANQPFSFELTGLPHHSPVPRRIALTVAALVLLVGAWLARQAPDQEAQGEDRKRLIARREKLLQDLVRLENDHRKGRIDEARFVNRREDLVSALENVYGALDTDEAAIDARIGTRSGAPLTPLGAS